MFKLLTTLFSFLVVGDWHSEEQRSTFTLNVPLNHLGILLEYRFWFSRLDSEWALSSAFRMLLVYISQGEDAAGSLGACSQPSLNYQLIQSSSFSLPFAPFYLLKAAAISFCRINCVTWWEIILSPVGLQGCGNFSNWEVLNNKEKFMEGEGTMWVENEREWWWWWRGRGRREEKNITGLIGMWKCVYVRDLLTHV